MSRETFVGGEQASCLSRAGHRDPRPETSRHGPDHAATSVLLFWRGAVYARRAVSPNASMACSHPNAKLRPEIVPLLEAPSRQLPRVFDPPQGLLVTANHLMLGADYPYPIRHDYAHGYRGHRIRTRLSGFSAATEPICWRCSSTPVPALRHLEATTATPNPAGASPNALFPPPRGPPAHRPPRPIQQHCCKTALNFLFFILRTTGIGIICRT